MDDVVVSLADCAEIIFGRNIDKAKTNSDGVGLPYIVGASDLQMGRYVPSRWCGVAVKSPSYTEAGDLLVSVVGTLGKMGVNTVGTAILSGHVCAIRPKQGVSRQYIMAMVSRLILEAIPNKEGVVLGFQSKLRPDMLSAIRFTLPDLILQEWLVARLTSIASIILAYRGKKEDFQSCERSSCGNRQGTIRTTLPYEESGGVS